MLVRISVYFIMINNNIVFNTEGVMKMDTCSHDCSSCESNCAQKKESLKEPCNKYSNIKKVIGVVSGKGGVGKSLVTSYAATLMNRKGYKTAILDADITGPSIPKAFGIKGKALGNEMGILPRESQNGTKVMSINLLLESEAMPVLWRGPIVIGAVKQFWTDVLWEDVDYMFVDMPPGTGDVPLTVFQSLPLDGIIIVTSPQELVSLIVEKAVNMAKAMDIPILGLVENYSYIQCGNCGEKMSVFGESHVDDIAKRYNLNVLAKLPIDSKIAEAVDKGEIEKLEGDWLDGVANYIEQNLEIKENEVKADMKIAVPCEEDNINEHYGKCTSFKVFVIKNGELDKKYGLSAMNAEHETVSQLLKDESVDTVLCGGIGQGAMESLFKHNIVVIPGLKGNVDVAVGSYLDEVTSR